MEFIRHEGELQCSNPRCNKIDGRRKIYYCWHDEKQVYWFVCDKCKEWTRLSFGYEEIGTLAPELRRKNEKIQKDFDKSFSKYGATW